MTIEAKIISLLILLAMVGGLIAGEKWYEHHIYQQGFTAANDLRDKQDAKKLAADTAQSHKMEVLAQLQETYATQKRLQEKQDHEKDKRAAVAAALAGHSGMRNPGVSVCPIAPPGTPASGPSTAPEDRQLLVPEVARSVLDLAGDIQQSVRDKNDLIDAYNRLRSACMAPVN